MQALEAPALAGADKAAVLLIMLGEQSGTDLIRHLSPEEIETLGRKVSAVTSIESRHAEEVLEEYLRMTQARQYVLRGGADYARRMLMGVLGEEGATKLIERCVQVEPGPADELDRIESADPGELATLLQPEHPQAIAVMLSRLSPSRAGAVLQSFPAALQTDVALRLANLDRIAPEIVAKIADVLGKKLQTTGGVTGARAGGVRVVAEIFNSMNAAAAEDVLTLMNESDANTTELVRHHMFVFEDIASLGLEALKQVVSRIDRAVLTIALKGTSDKLKDSIMQCMSQRGAEMLRDDMEVAGPARIRDVQEAQKKVIVLVRQLQAEGAIGRAGEEYVV
jgi:flagellar motor switch protein FliG